MMVENRIAIMKAYFVVLLTLSPMRKSFVSRLIRIDTGDIPMEHTKRRPYLGFIAPGFLLYTFFIIIPILCETHFEKTNCFPKRNFCYCRL